MPEDLNELLEESSFSPGLKALAVRGTLRSYRKDTLLIQEGDLGDALFIVLKGRVKAFSMDINGKEVTYGIYGSGEYLGEMSLDGGPRSASVVTVEPCLCVVVTKAILLAHIASDPEFAFELLARVIRRARLATQSARNMVLLDVYGRLVQVLEGLALPSDADGVRTITERLTHQELASRVGCSREMVSRLLKDLEKGGYLKADGKRFFLLRPLPSRW